MLSSFGGSGGRFYLVQLFSFEAWVPVRISCRVTGSQQLSGPTGPRGPPQCTHPERGASELEPSLCLEVAVAAAAICWHRL